MKIIVTDLTRFKNPDIVCLAGIDLQTGSCVRPMKVNGNKLDYFPFAAVKANQVMPGSCLVGNFEPVADASAPHVEDHRSTGRVEVVDSSTGKAFEDILRATSHTTIRTAFGSQPQDRLYLPSTCPPLSIATIRLDSPRTQFSLVIDEKFGPAKFKAHLIDADGFRISWLPVTDLGFADHVAKVVAQDPHLNDLNKFLRSQKTIYLRIGLSRQYAASPGRDGYWVQLNGIYSFPSFRKDLRVYD